MKRKILSLFLAMVLVFSIIPFTVFAENAPTVSMGGKYTVKPGETVSIPVTLSGNDNGLGALVFTCSFDENISCTKVTNGGLFGSLSAKTGNNPMRVTLYSEENVTNGTIVTMDFTVSADCEEGEYPLTLALSSASRVSDNGKTEKVKNIAMNSGTIVVAKDNFSGDITIGDGDTTVGEDAEDKTFTYTYDGQAHGLTLSGTELPDEYNVTYSYQKVVAEGDDAVAATSTAPVDAGTYEVTATLTADGYKDKVVNATIVIDQKTLTVSGMTAEDKVYDGTTDATVSGGVLEGVVEYKNEAGEVTGKDNVTATFPTKGTFASKNASADPIAVAVDIILGGADAGNYTVQAPELTANISKYTVEIQPISNQKVVGKDDPTLQFKVNGGETVYNSDATVSLVGEDTITVTLSRAAGEDVNTTDGYTISAAYVVNQGAGCDNYAVTAKTGKFIITEAAVTGITVNGSCKTNYIHGDTFDPTGLTVTATYENGRTREITDYTYAPATLALDTDKVAISYAGFTEYVNVTVIPKLTGITVTVAKTEYVENQTFDKTGMTVTATYSDGKSYDVTNSVNVTPSGALKPSNDVVVVSYEDANKQTASANVSIHVVAKAVDRIDVTTPPTKTSYIEGQTFDPTGMVVTATYNDGTSFPVTDYDYSPKTLTKGTTVVTISFRDKTTTVGVTVREKALVSIAVDASKAKTTYVVGQTFSADNLVVTATYDNGTTATVTGYEVSTPDMTKTGKQTVTVTYQGKTATYEIEISAKALTGIALDLNKVTRSFYVDDEFSAKGLVVYALYNDDTSVQVSGYEVTVPDMKTAGSKTVYVSYTEGSVTKTAAYDIYVSEKSTAKTYTITVIAGKNGSVYGSTIVPEGEDATFRFFPDEGYQVADVVVNGKSVGAVSSYTFKNVRADATLTVTFAKASSLPFYDVAESAWYYDSVVFVYNNGLMEGVSSTRFAPTADFSRAMIAQVLYNLEGRPAVSRGKTFTDVSASAWYADAVAWVTENGIFLGFGDGTFAPNTSISREQMATVLYRYVVYKGYNVKSADSLDYFSDGKTVSAWAKEGVAWAVSNGILGGYTDGTLRPLGTASRAEVAKMLTVFMERIVG
ncbi:MAG: bacterial Ig-like domain-containing protein [Candidatus Avoscillospira sp.]